MKPFGWRRLTPVSTLEHRLDSNGELVIRGVDPSEHPFSIVRVRDGKGGFVEKHIDALDFCWSMCADGDGWVLRTWGPPVTMAHTAARWLPDVTNASSDTLVDERFLLTTIASEVGDLAPDKSGLVRAPRTERGYPRRSGERDHGDGARDAEDWAAYIASGRRGTTHSSHGLMQTLISTAVGVRPKLFAEVAPESFRDVLAKPANAIACGAAYAATFPAEVRGDPLAARFQHGAGSVRPAHNRWGAVLYDELVPLAFIAFWNDLACVRTGRCALAKVPQEKTDLSKTAAWLFAAFSCFILAIAASFAASFFVRR
jgi:hypothetical protein